ncbi:MAG: hypothetical protein ACLR6B_13790 [Blautia sp.]
MEILTDRGEVLDKIYDHEITEEIKPMKKDSKSNAGTGCGICT